VSELDEFFAVLAVVPDRDTAGFAVDADLRVELTTAAGRSTTALVTGHGQRLRVETRRPDQLITAVDRVEMGRAAELLAAAGITVDVCGPRGPVATLGAGTSNRVGRAITGSRHVAADLAGALRLAWATRPVRTTAIVLPAVAAVLAVMTRMRLTRAR
jgi:hypothetical protein